MEEEILTRTVAEKMGIRAGSRAYFVNAPAKTLSRMALPDLNVFERLPADVDYIHLFCVTQSEMTEQFPRLRRHVAEAGTLWLSWPKGRQLGSDLTLPKVIEIGYSHGMVESTCLSVDAVWSGLKFTHPKQGKAYHNSYGTLPA